MTMTKPETTTRAAQATDTDTIFANPYAFGGRGFYFTTLDEYQAGMLRLWPHDVEEVELSYCDGPRAELFNAAAIGQHNVHQWFDMLDTIDDWQLPALYYLLDDQGETLADALQQLDDVMVTEGTALDYATSYIDECGLLDSMPEQLQRYFDTAAFTRDMLINGDVTEFQYDSTTYTAQEV